jgi:hypothetical protein
VQSERNGWILMQSVSPRQAAIWLADKRAALNDPEFRELYLEYEAAFDWSPDDPRLYALADRTQRWLAGRSSPRKGGADGSIHDRAIAQLVATSAGASSPAWDRLTEIAKELKASQAEIR